MDESGKVPKRLPENVIDRLVKTQYQKALNEAEQIKLRIRNSDHQADYAKRLLEYQAQIITNRPEEHRKTVTRYAYVTVMILFVFLGFITTCLYIGKEEFIRYFLQIVSYIVVSAFSFYFGRKTGGRKDNGVKEAEVVDSQLFK
ncbi:hypothetical protein KK083_11590 [Fulvivirgaceae bacterium PWU4]|uniref:Uncharacterized protein n=1 Tax=Chryseosolibacter histidini TaxID=2782349 RepID=A0AAP2GPK1_9BACT|nr:hypothetical protein [Chryseosolibacter histidini]MBT1697522.1 hypothetical protein [Chryseosolibacter histidini]